MVLTRTILGRRRIAPVASPTEFGVCLVTGTYGRAPRNTLRLVALGVALGLLATACGSGAAGSADHQGTANWADGGVRFPVESDPSQGANPKHDALHDALKA